VSIWGEFGVRIVGIKRAMGSVRVGLGKAAEEGRMPSLKLSNRVPEAQNRIL